MKWFLFFTLFTLSAFAVTYPNLKIGDSSPMSSFTLMEVNSTAKGVLIPRMTTTQRNAISSVISTIPLGLLVYDTTIDSTCQRITSSWACLPPMSTSSFPLLPNRLIAVSSIGNTLIQLSSAGTSGQVLTSNGSSSPPSFQSSAIKSWSGYHDSTCYWPVTNTSFTDASIDNTCAFATRTNTNLGNVSALTNGTAGNMLPGIIFTPTSLSVFNICAKIMAGNGSAGNQGTFRLTDGTTEIAQAGSYNNSSNNMTLPLCGIYQAVSTVSTIIKIQFKATGGDAHIDSNGNTNAIEWSIFQL